jgi:hypothetical protein
VEDVKQMLGILVALLLASAALAAALYRSHQADITLSAGATAQWYPASTSGAVAADSTATWVLRLKNTSKTKTLTGTVAIEPGGSPGFSLIAGAGAYSLPPLASRMVTLRFVPADSTGTATCRISSGP